MFRRIWFGLFVVLVLLLVAGGGQVYGVGNEGYGAFLPAVFKPEPIVPPPTFDQVQLIPAVTILSGLPSYNGPALLTSIRHAGDGRLFATERDGYVHVVENGVANPEPFLDIRHLVAIDSSFSASEQGLLSLAFHPNYAQNGYFFVSYVEDVGENGRSVIARFQVSADNPNKADPNSFLRILTVGQPTKSHNGGDIHFGPDGYLYLGLGDGTRTDKPDPNNGAQNMRVLLGKIIRLNVDTFDPNAIDCGYAAGDHYSIPPDNPFVNDGGACNEIWASGLRNPWRFSFDRETGELYIADVGMHTREEINIAPPGDKGGQNYGWRCYEGGWPIFPDSCTQATVNQITWPVLEFDHATQGACSIKG
ncbi:MAG: PQQ-dependent sugar dehydrogenase, partial [Anaerolineales bacterium]|nr:PQQ-dependent sugar dehydrogenase [Anaerolineales bacterium]